MPVSKHFLKKKLFIFTLQIKTYETLLLFQLRVKLNVDLVVIVQTRVFVYVHRVSPEKDVKNAQVDSLGQIVKNANVRELIKMFAMTDWQERVFVNATKDLLVKIVIHVLLVFLEIIVKVRYFFYILSIILFMIRCNSIHIYNLFIDC